MELPKNHYSLIHAQEVRQICAPLFEATPITHFTYSRLYNSGETMLLVSDPEYHEHFWRKGYNEEFFQNYSAGIYLSRTLCSEAIKDAAEFHINFPMMQIHKKPDYFEAVGLATNIKDNNIFEFYLKNLDLIENFLYYFKYQARFLIEKSKNELLISSAIIEKNNAREITTPQIVCKPNKYIINTRSGDKYITIREYDCLKLLAKGLTSKQIAQALDISYRTVESYLGTVKQRLNINYKSELITIFTNNFHFQS